MNGRRDVVLSTVMENTVEVECALEILSLFMLSLCERMNQPRIAVMHMNGKTALLKDLAQEVIDAELAISIIDAMMYVVPAFARLGLMEDIHPS